MKKLFYFLLLFTPISLFSQVPSYSAEKDVTIIGLTFDAMEPFISPDGNFLFFNNLNDGINTKLYYATYVNDSTFNFVGELNGCNQITPPYLDAVADMDASGYFLWTSTRDYPAEFDNLHHGAFTAGIINNIGRVHGDFYIYLPGWLIMDHGISNDGQFLYYNNARFDGVCSGPCETNVGIAQKVNDSTFNTIINSSAITQNINDTSYLNYATCITSDNLELYYTRFLKGTVTPTTTFEMCVAIRNTATDTFSAPVVLFSETINNIVEAPTLTIDKQIMYYHKKVLGVHVIKMRHRLPASSINQKEETNTFNIYPNPTSGNITIDLGKQQDNIRATLTNTIAQVIFTKKYCSTAIIEINLTAPKGIYFLQLTIDGQIITKKLMKL
jgi:hypothetical protein